MAQAPTPKSPPAPPGEPEVAPTALVGKILFVDDDPLMRSAANRSLRKLAGSIEVAPTAEAGLEAFKSGRHELVISDHQLPGMSGLDLVRQVRELSPNTVCILLTGMQDPELYRDATQVLGDRVFVKPLERGVLERAVRSALGVKEEKPVSEEGVPFGKYRLLRRIGVGGMAEVHLARRSGIADFQKQVAIKLMLPEFSNKPDFREMFFDEGRLIAGLSHPNVAQVFEMGMHEQRCFIAMEYIEGESLSSVLQRMRSQGQTPSLTFAFSVMAQLLDALEYVHTACDENKRPLLLVHRDITPSNVMLTSRGQAKLLDFGVAKATSNVHETKVGLIKGKLQYMSPEQVSGHAIDHRSDLYAAGVLLYVMLAGRPAFPGTSEIDVIIAMKEAKVQPLRELRPDLPMEVDRVVMRALTADPKGRYQSAAEFKLALRSIISKLGLFEDQRAVAEALASRLDEAQPSAPSSESVVLGPSQVMEVVDDAPVPPRSVLSDSAQMAGFRGNRTWLYAGLGFAALVVVAVIAFASGSGEGPKVAEADPAEAPEVPVAVKAEPKKAEPKKLDFEPAKPEPKKPEPKRPDVAAAPAPAPAPKPASPKAPKPSALASYGRLNISSSPGAHVWVAGKDHGKVPVGLDLAPGIHAITLVHEQLGVRRTFDIQVKEGIESDVSIELQ